MRKIIKYRFIFLLHSIHIDERKNRRNTLFFVRIKSYMSYGSNIFRTKNGRFTFVIVTYQICNFYFYDIKIVYYRT